jgi:hypothetical protein
MRSRAPLSFVTSHDITTKSQLLVVEQHQRCRVASDQGVRVGGFFRMERSKQYRRFAQECLEMARPAQSPQTRAILMQMAQVWFRLAEERVSDVAEHLEV